MKRARKKQKKSRRLVKRIKSHRKWKHGRSNAEKVRRKEEARAASGRTSTPQVVP